MNRRSQYISLICILLFTLPIKLLYSQYPNSNFFRIDTNTTSERRAEFRLNLYDRVIMKNLSLALNNDTEDKWMGAYWACKFSYCSNEFVKNSLKTALSHYFERSKVFNRATLEAIYTLYPAGFENEISELIDKINSPKDFAIAVHYILRVHSYDSLLIRKYHEQLIRKFMEWNKDPILIMLENSLNYYGEKVNTALPDIQDLIKGNKWDGKTVIFSFLRKDRDFEGITIIRNSNGKFLKDSTGQIFNINHLARSLSNLPGYLTNGNTPCGIFSIIQTDTSANRFIGKTPIIVTALPFEVPVDVFFKDSSMKNTKWDIELYKKILPPSWRNFFPIYEAYYAGMAGRSEIVMHGTTIDPVYYSDYPYYPNTPSLGCLTAKELYSPTDGKLILSDQQRLVDYFNKCDNKAGFLVVVELDNKKSKVSLDEILPFLKDSDK